MCTLTYSKHLEGKPKIKFIMKANFEVLEANTGQMALVIKYD